MPECALEHPEGGSYARDVEPRLGCQYRHDVVLVLASAGEHLHYDDILGPGDINGDTFDAPAPAPPQELFFQSWPGKHDVDGHAGRRVDDGKNPCLCNESAHVANAESKALPLQCANQFGRVAAANPHGYVHIRGES